MWKSSNTTTPAVSKKISIRRSGTVIKSLPSRSSASVFATCRRSSAWSCISGHRGNLICCGRRRHVHLKLCEGGGIVDRQALVSRVKVECAVVDVDIPATAKVHVEVSAGTVGSKSKRPIACDAEGGITAPVISKTELIGGGAHKMEG